MIAGGMIAWQTRGLDRHAGKAGWRRALLFLLVVATAATGALLMFDIIVDGDAGWLVGLFLVGFTLSFAWLALSFWTGFFGFALAILRRHPVSLRKHRPGRRRRSRPAPRAPPC